jgi:hypothetical protein
MKIRVTARMVHWGIRLVFFAIVLGVVGFSEPVVQARCAQIMCVNGGEGEYCETGKHYAYESQFGTREGEDHPTSCLSDTCDDDHPQCIGGLPAVEMDALEYAAIRGDLSKIESMLGEYQSLTVNTERSALQRLDCAGAVVWHFPMPSTLIQDLSAEQR